MSRCSIVAVAMLAAGVSAPRLAAQGAAPVCPGAIPSELPAQDACELGADFARYIAPQLGGALAGGNAVPGSGGTLGRLGRFSVGVRVNALRGSVPQVAFRSPSMLGASPSSWGVTTRWFAAPTIDAAISVFGGIPLRLSRLGSVDLLANASWIDEARGRGRRVHIDQPGGTLHLGYGARVGLLDESFTLPGVSASVMHRRVPAVDMIATMPEGDLLPRPLVHSEMSDLRVASTAWRVTAGKHLYGLGVVLGGGQDRHAFDGWARGTLINEATTFTSVGRVDDVVTRTTFFANVSLDLWRARIVGEVGRATNGDLRTYHVFDERASDYWSYWSLGVRFAR